ncbi:MAG: TonB-dependent receptor [Dysgonamonadaceae bacterium]|jgi:hypothetical protein|nr:TonB-dependent receptor [Dysgonamonadaceae bacterium]
MNVRFLVLALVILLGPLLLKAQKSRITGIVTDSEGLPIELATVGVRGTLNGAFTDEKGRYSLSVTTGDSCVLVFSCLGYNKTQRVIPSVDGDMQVSVRMRRLSLSLDGVTVTAGRIQTNTLDHLDPTKARFIADPSGGSIESLIVTYAGVSSTNELSSQYSVRGGNYDENIIYVNGIEVYRPLLIRSGQQEGLSFINPDLTASVGFSSGGFDAHYGDKMSSVLDVTYKKPSELEGAATASMLGGNVYVGSASNRFTQITGFRYKRGTTLLKTLDTKGDYEPTFMDLQNYMTYTFSPKLELNTLLNFAKNVYHYTPSQRNTSFGTLQDVKNFTVYYDGSERDEFNTLFGAMTLKYNPSEHAMLGLQVSAFQSKEKETFDIGGEYWLEDVLDADEAGTQHVPIGTGLFHEHARDRLHSRVVNISQIGSLKSANHALSWAAGIQQEKISDYIKEWEMRDSMGYSLPYDEDALKVYSNLFSENELSSVRFSGYLQDTYKFRTSMGLFSITAGVRGSYWDFNKEFIFSPRASVGLVPSRNQNLTFRFATGIYYQSPFYKEFRMINTDSDGNQYITLNDQIRSQRSIHFVLGGDYSFHTNDRPFRFTAEAYYKKLNNLVPYSVNDVRIRYYGDNAAKGFTTGLDMKLFGEFVPGTDSWLSFSLMKTEQDRDGIKTPLPTDQRYNISLFFTDYFPNFDRIKFNLKAIWSDGLPYSTPNYVFEPRFRSKGYRRVDMGMAYLLLDNGDKTYDGSLLRRLKSVWFGIDAFNLLDINNVSSYLWFSDIQGNQYAVPNYLTGRQINLKLLIEF